MFFKGSGLEISRKAVVFEGSGLEYKKKCVFVMGRAWSHREKLCFGWVGLGIIKKSSVFEEFVGLGLELRGI